jgi:hypothetical protein
MHRSENHHKSSTFVDPLARMPKRPRLADAAPVAQALIDRQDNEEVLKAALSEMRKARRSRSRTWFAFWDAVATLIRNNSSADRLS